MHGLPLKDVLAAVRLTRIDLLSLDVEGHEFQVLQGLGPEILSRIGLVIIENASEMSRALLSVAGLRQVDAALPDWYIHPARVDGGYNSWFAGPSLIQRQSPAPCHSKITPFPRSRFGSKLRRHIATRNESCPDYTNLQREFDFQYGVRVGKGRHQRLCPELNGFQRSAYDRPKPSLNQSAAQCVEF